MSFSLRDWQRVAIVRMFQLRDANTSSRGDAELEGPDATWSEEWKVLVYDAETRAIIAPLLSVSELRSLGVTLHMAIEAPRDAIPDVSVVYFLSPSPMNVRHLVDDASVGRYRDLYINFASPCGKQALEVLARGCVESGSVARVRRVCDQYLGYTSLEHRLFTLSMGDSYAGYAAPGLTEAAVEAYARSVAAGLLAVFATVGTVPVIVAARNGPAEMVARFLDAALRDHLASGGGVFSATSSGGGRLDAGPVLPGGRRPQPLGFGAGARPALLLLDRGMDLSAPLAHASTYEALVDDTLGPIALNRVTLPPEGAAADAAALREGRDPRQGADSGGAGAGGAAGWMEWASAAAAGKVVGGAGGSGGGPGGKGKTATLDAEGDPFWRAHAHGPFPEAIDAHHTELAAVVAREAEIRRNAGGGATAGADAGLDDAAAAALASLPESMGGGASGAADGGGDLTQALDSLPALLRRKRVLETHTALLQAVMDRVAARTIPHFYDAEVTAVAVAASGGVTDIRPVLALTSDPEKGSFEDRLRLACVYLLASGGGGEGAGAPAPGGASDDVEALLSSLVASLKGSGGGANGAAAAGGGAPSSQLSARAQAQADRAAGVLAYIRQLRSAPSLPGGPGASSRIANFSAGVSTAMSGLGLNSGSAGGKLVNMLTSTTSSLLTKAAASVNRLVQGELRRPVTRVVQALCEGKPSAAAPFPLDGCLVLDPRVIGGGGSGVSRERTYGAYVASAAAASGSAGVGGGGGAGGAVSFRNAFVFTVGGGTYGEYHDVLAYAAACTPPRTVVYGATEVLSSAGFLGQLEGLGRGAPGSAPLLSLVRK